VEVKLHILTSALDRGDWSASHPGRFTPLDTKLMGPRTGFNVVEKMKSLSLT
jgi:hypothetical protein